MSNTALMAAIKRKFSSPREVMRRLGLDEDLLRSTPNGCTGKEPPKAMRGGLGGEHAVAIMDHLAGKLSAEEMSDLNLLLDRLLGDSKVAAAEDDEPEPDRLRAHLIAKGLSDRDAAAAIGIARGEGKDTTNGVGAMDRRTGSDEDFYRRFPGAASITPDARGMAFDRRRIAPAPSESEADLSDFYSRFPDSERIQI